MDQQSQLNQAEQKPKARVYIVNKKNRYQIQLKSFLIFLLFIVLILIEYFQNGSYLDEAIGVVSLVYLLLFNSKIKKYDLLTFFILIIVTILGLLSNWYSALSVPLKSIGVDAVTQVKVIASFFALKYFLSDREKQTTIEMFVIPAKLFCVISFICSILTQFIDTGMSPETRYGINCFNFIFDFNFQYISTYMLVFGVFVCSKNITDKVRFRYYFMSVVSIAMNTKSEALIFSILFILLFFYLKKYKRINFAMILLMLVLIIIAGQYQINTYLAKEGTARHEFWEYAFKTANNYFPFGSGYATYGSAEAAKNYSPLYYLYGFTNVWGMSPDYRAFLTDTYWASIIGQFGWIGFMLIAVVYVRIFISFTNSNFRYDRRAFLYAAFAQYIIHAIGSGIIISSSGMIGFMAMSLCTHTDSVEDSTFHLPKMRISF